MNRLFRRVYVTLFVYSDDVIRDAESNSKHKRVKT